MAMFERRVIEIGSETYAATKRYGIKVIEDHRSLELLIIFPDGHTQRVEAMPDQQFNPEASGAINDWIDRNGFIYELAKAKKDMRHGPLSSADARRLVEVLKHRLGVSVSVNSKNMTTLVSFRNGEQETFPSFELAVTALEVMVRTSMKLGVE